MQTATKPEIPHEDILSVVITLKPDALRRLFEERDIKEVGDKLVVKCGDVWYEAESEATHV